MTVPATFLVWFVLPLLPWLRYGVLRRRARELVGLGVITVLYLALTLGPSQAVALPLAAARSSSTSTSA